MRFFRKPKTESEILWLELLALEPSRNDLDCVIRKCPKISEAAFEIWEKGATAEELRDILRCDNKAIRKRASEVLLERFASDQNVLLDIIRHGDDSQAKKAFDMYAPMATEEELVKRFGNFEYWWCRKEIAKTLVDRQAKTQHLRYAMQIEEYRALVWERIKNVATAEDLAWVAIHVEDCSNEAVSILLGKADVPVQCLKDIAKSTRREDVFERVWATLPALSLDELQSIVKDVYGDQPIIKRAWTCLMDLHPTDKELFKVLWDSFQLKQLAWDEVKTHDNLDPHALSFVIDRQHELKEEAWQVLKKQPLTIDKAQALFSVICHCAYGEKFDGLETELIRALIKHDLGAKSYRKIIDYAESRALKEIAAKKLETTKEGILERLLELGKQ